MNYNVKGTGVEITPEIRAYLEKQLSHVEKFLASDPTAIVAVELEHTPMRHGERNRAEFTVSAAGEVYRVEAWGETLHAAIDLAEPLLARELRRSKNKRLHVLRRSAARVKEYLRGWRDRP